jgi:hypothetical protein
MLSLNEFSWKTSFDFAYAYILVVLAFSHLSMVLCGSSSRAGYTLGAVLSFLLFSPAAYDPDTFTRLIIQRGLVHILWSSVPFFWGKRTAYFQEVCGKK